MTTTLNIPPTTTPCPDWCDLPAGHGYDVDVPASDGSGAYARFHSCTFGEDTGADITAWARAAWGAETEDLEFEGVNIWVNGTNIGPVMSAPQARVLASHLLEAADRLDAITSGAA